MGGGETMIKEYDMNETGKKLCTASNKAFLCISSHIVTFFLIEQSYVAKTSCKMGVQNTWGFHGDISIYPCGQNNKNILLSSKRSEYLFSIGSMKDNPSLKCRRTEQNKEVRVWPPLHFLACLVTMLRGGVTGRLPLGFFFSAGFKIYTRLKTFNE